MTQLDFTNYNVMVERLDLHQRQSPPQPSAYNRNHQNIYKQDDQIYRYVV